MAGERLAVWKARVELVHTDYRSFDELLDGRGIDRVDGVLADLGHSTVQLEMEGRGFSFRRDDPLDMRMDRTQGSTLAELLNGVTPDALADVIFEFGEERHSRRVARAIVKARDGAGVTSTLELASIVRRAIRHRGHARIDPATRTFQALRIWVNGELDGLTAFLRSAVHRLQKGSRLVVISFHSLEDRIAKYALRELEQADEPLIRVLTRKPVRAGPDEVRRNPRARSAKLRAAERVV
jgi:16S rRNA (cytosine1402-N4)-methyltransferase